MKRLILIPAALLCVAATAWSARVAQTESAAKAQANDDPAVLARGKEIYDSRCKMCHKADGKAALEEMDLTDGVWRHGSTPEAVEKVIREGVKETGMRPIQGDYTDADIKALVKYVLKFSENATPAAPAPAAPPAEPAKPPIG